MGAKYWLYSDEYKKYLNLVDRGEAFQVEIMDQDEKVWKLAKIMILPEQSGGAHSGGLLGRFGEPTSEGKFFVKVLEELSSPLDDED